MENKNIAADDLNKLVRKVLNKAGCILENSALVADALVAAEKDGIPSHGVSRVPLYADQLISGKINGQAIPECIVSGTIIKVDAGSGFAFPAIRAGLDKAMRLIDDSGLMAVAVKRSHHAGVLGHHAEYAALKGFLTLAFCNTPSAMAHWGGRTPLFGTNPIALSCPRRHELPLVIDLALSKVARGKIMLAQQQGRSIPDNWAIGPDGERTSDPETALKGAMLPVGSEKGAALALMVEILAAALAGANFSFEASSFLTKEGDSPNVGQFFILIDPARFSVNFLDRVEVLFGLITNEEGCRLPGSRRKENREKAERSGINLPMDLFLDLIARQ